MTQLAHKIRLYPNQEAEAYFRRAAGVARHAWNRDVNAAVNIKQVAQRHWETQTACGEDISPAPRPLRAKVRAASMKQESGTQLLTDLVAVGVQNA